MMNTMLGRLTRGAPSAEPPIMSWSRSRSSGEARITAPRPRFCSLLQGLREALASPGFSRLLQGLLEARHGGEDATLPCPRGPRRASAVSAQPFGA